MLSAFSHRLRELLPSDGVVLVAVSGGIDSMTMADMFLNCGVPFAVAHCNFHLRGDESDSDERLVCSWCEKNGVAFRKIDFETTAYAEENGISIEMAARDLRYRWFADLCRENGYIALAVAHNANDNAETLILNLLRGTGLKGLTGMNPVSTIPVEGCDVPLMRPLLEFSRSDIHSYATVHGLGWHEDRTNADSTYKRNCIRNEIFPLFEKLNPSFLQSLGLDMKHLSQAEKVADSWFIANRDNVADIDGSRMKVGIAELKSLDNSRYMLYRLLEPYGFNETVINSVEALVWGSGTISGKVFRSATHRLVTSGDSLIVEALPDGPWQDEVIIDGPGTFDFNGRRFVVDVMDNEPGMNLRQPEGTIILDAEACGFPLDVRGWGRGDWMVPFGMKGRKKISNMFVDLKMGLPEKEKAAVVVLSGSRVAALLCRRTDDSVKVTRTTSKIIRIRESI